MIIELIIKISFLIIFVLVASSILYGAPYVVSDKKTIYKIFKLIGSVKGKRVVDLGSGDGRLILELASRGANATGYEINPILVLISKIRILFSKNRRNENVFIANYWQKNLKESDVVVVFGIIYIMSKLESKFEKELKKGTKVISVSYKLPNWKPTKSFQGVYLYEK